MYLGNGHVIQWWYNSKGWAFSKMPPHRNSFLEAVTITEVEVMAEAKVRCCQSFGRPRTGLHLPPEMSSSIPPFLCFPIPPVFCAGRCPRLRCSLEHWGIRAERHQGRICTFSFSDPEESEVLRIVDVHVLGNIPVYTATI